MSPRLRVLVVDDDARTARVLARMLREDGFEVEVATGGGGAMGRLARSAPDVLVTDLEMPEADGLAVARYAREQRPDLPVFLVTGHPEQSSTLERALTPSPCVFAKPVDYAELSRALTVAAGAHGADGAAPGADDAAGPAPNDLGR